MRSPADSTGATQPTDVAPYPGSHDMPQWEVGPLAEPPAFQWGWRTIPLLLGPGLVMGASAIGGGEWLTGPLNTARYGGAILWLATLSIIGQTLYNIEISRYTLYTGEPIFTGKFRTKPGPRAWLPLYLVLRISVHVFRIWPRTPRSPGNRLDRRRPGLNASITLSFIDGPPD
ncbi:MAG: hypothetical protein U0992_02805 [Planctomycetaceae bacterium]